MGFLILLENNPSQNPIKNQSGSMILVAMLLLLMMTIIGISASNTSVTESYIIRNVGIYKQNMNMVESAVLELAQEALVNISSPANFRLAEDSAGKERWIIPLTDWNDAANFPYRSTGMSYHDAWYDTGDNGSGRLFTDDDDDPATFPQYTWPGDDFFAGNTTPSPSGALTQLGGILNIRNEAADTPLRMALVGWIVADGAEMSVTTQNRWAGRILAEYVSPRYGMMRLEIGVERLF